MRDEDHEIGMSSDSYRTQRSTPPVDRYLLSLTTCWGRRLSLLRLQPQFD
jgi:hypothetical protein